MNFAAKQSRTMSLAEAVTNILVGFAFALVVQIAVFPMFGIFISASDNVLIATMFTTVSLIRSFILRRVFEWARVSGLRPRGARP